MRGDTGAIAKVRGLGGICAGETPKRTPDTGALPLRWVSLHGDRARGR